MEKIKVYTASALPLCDTALFDSLSRFIPASRREKLKKLRFETDRRLSLAASLLLVYALREKGVTAFEIVRGKYGKPYLKNENIFFSLSHSGDRVLCAISPDAVGCDIEKIRETDFKVADRFFHPSEQKALTSLSDNEKTDLFFRLWVLKESYMKATGKGLAMSPSSFRISTDAFPSVHPADKPYYFKEYITDGYKTAVASTFPHFGTLQTIDLRTCKF